MNIHLLLFICFGGVFQIMNIFMVIITRKSDGGTSVRRRYYSTYIRNKSRREKKISSFVFSTTRGACRVAERNANQLNRIIWWTCSKLGILSFTFLVYQTRRNYSIGIVFKVMPGLFFLKRQIFSMWLQERRRRRGGVKKNLWPE